MKQEDDSAPPDIDHFVEDILPTFDENGEDNPTGSFAISRPDDNHYMRPDGIGDNPFDVNPVQQGSYGNRNDYRHASNGPSSGLIKTVAGIVAVCMMIGISITWIVVGGDSDDKNAADPPKTSEVTTTGSIFQDVPDGWTSQYDWSAETTPDASPLILPDGSIAFLADGRTVVVASADDNKEVLREKVDEDITAMSRGGTPESPIVSWRTASSVFAWSEKTGTNKMELPPGDPKLYGTSIRPYLWKAGDPTVHVISDDLSKINPIRIPDGTTPISYSDGNIMSSSGGNDLIATPVSGGASKKIKIDLPSKKIIRKWIGTHGSILVVGIDKRGGANSKRLATLAYIDVNTGKIIDSVNLKWGAIDNAVVVSDKTKKIVGAANTFLLGSKAVEIKGRPEANILSILDEGNIYLLDEDTAGVATRNNRFDPLSPQSIVPIGTTKDGNALTKVGNRVYSLRSE